MFIGACGVGRDGPEGSYGSQDLRWLKQCSPDQQATHHCELGGTDSSTRRNATRCQPIIGRLKRRIDQGASERKQNVSMFLDSDCLKSFRFLPAGGRIRNAART